MVRLEPGDRLDCYDKIVPPEPKANPLKAVVVTTPTGRDVVDGRLVAVGVRGGAAVGSETTNRLKQIILASSSLR